MIPGRHMPPLRPKIPKDMKFYHASPRRFRHGDILRGGCPGGYGAATDRVCMTTNPDPHVTIRSTIPGHSGHRPTPPKELEEEWDRIRDSYPDISAGWDAVEPLINKWQEEVEKERPPPDWFVYEVEPLSDPTFHALTGEYRATHAKVIRMVGKAKTLIEKRPHTPAYALPPSRERERQQKRKERQDRREERMNPSERVAARFLVASDYFKNQR